MTIKRRSTTNLVVPQHLQLERPDMKKRFMYVYSAAYPGLEPVFMNKLWLSHFFPEIARDPTFGKDRKELRKYAEAFEKHSKAGLLKLKKVNSADDPHFVVAVPLAEFNRYDLGVYVTRLKMWFTAPLKSGSAPFNDSNTDHLAQILKDGAEAGGVQQEQVLASKVIPAIPGLDANGRAALTECFFGLRLVFSGGLAVVYADFKITKVVVQQSTTTERAM